MKVAEKHIQAIFVVLIFVSCHTFGEAQYSSREGHRSVHRLRDGGAVGGGRLVRRSAGQSEQGGVVEEVFGRSAVIGADESRRIYAISIPRVYQVSP